MKNILKINVPLTVPSDMKDEYEKNFLKATKKNAGKLFLFAGDQKIEHLNEDFYGNGIPEECADPKHLFEIAQSAPIGVFATQLGLISKYGNSYNNINYLVKLNSKTNLVQKKQAEPISALLNDVDDVVYLKSNSSLSIVGVGFTIYLGSQREAEMLSQASRIIFDAHKNGLLAVIWIYPRGKSVKNELDSNLIAGACGVAITLGADFVKVNLPSAKTSKESAKLLKQATLAAGETGVICSGGSLKEEKDILESIKYQVDIGGARGCAIGRNIHQKKLEDAISFCKKIDAIFSD